MYFLEWVPEVRNLVSRYNIPVLDPVAWTDGLDNRFAETLAGEPITRKFEKMAEVASKGRGGGRLKELPFAEVHGHLDQEDRA